MKYKVGTRVVFRSKHGKSARTGETAEVVHHGNNNDGSGISHCIRFADGHQMWAYPQELNPAPKKK